VLTAADPEPVLSVLLSSAYRRNSLERMDVAACGPAMLAALGRCMRRGSPIQLTVLAFPFKVPNPAKVGERKLPDFAELSAIRHIMALRAAIQAVYPPGLEFHILHDGALIGEVFGVGLREIHDYEAYFVRLVDMAGASDFIHCVDFAELQRKSGIGPNGAA